MNAKPFDEWYIPEPNSGCWLWLRPARKYGTINHGGRIFYAHRLSYELHRGPIPKGKSVLHRCDNSFCVNPDHLFLGTQADNMADMKAKGRHPGNSKTPGEDRPRAKLSRRIAEEIRASKELGIDLAKKYGVHRETIGRIRRKESYK